ncbi:MAG: hypothetical protein WCY71_12205 [Halothiobacillaceae bacterium]
MADPAEMPAEMKGVGACASRVGVDDVQADLNSMMATAVRAYPVGGLFGFEIMPS